MKSGSISIVAPVYNEQETIAKFVATTLQENLDSFQTLEIILVDDGSTDNTWNLICELVANNPKVLRGVKLSRNFGHQKAVLAGLKKSRFEKIAIIDADLQDPPRMIPELAQKLESGIDIVLAKRISREGESRLKIFTAKAFYWFLGKISDFEIPRNVGDFRVVSRRAVDLVLQMNEVSPFLRGLFAYTGLPTVHVEYVRQPRFAGSTHYSMRKMVSLSISAITGFSTLPARAALRFAALTFSLSVVFFLIAIFRFLLNGGVEGWFSIFGSIFLFGSLNLTLLALVLYYVTESLDTLRNRPKFVIQLEI